MNRRRKVAHKAVAEWIIKQSEYEAVKARDIEPGGKVKEGPDYEEPADSMPR